MRESLLLDMVHDLEYQYSAGIHTVGDCLTDDCKNHSRGRVYCRSCAEDRLAKLVGSTKAGRLARLFHQRMSTQTDIDEMKGELFD